MKIVNTYLVCYKYNICKVYAVQDNKADNYRYYIDCANGIKQITVEEFKEFSESM